MPSDQGDSASGLFSIDLDDLGLENKASSFPSIIFENSRSRSDGAENGDSGSSEEDDPGMLTAPVDAVTPKKAPPKKSSIRTLYIQMVCDSHYRPRNIVMTSSYRNTSKGRL